MSNNASYEAQIDQEMQNNILPVTKSERVWKFWDASWVNIGFAIATWCFMTGAVTARVVDFRTTVWITLAANGITVVILAIATTINTAKYGIDTYQSTVSFTGRKGVIAVVIAFVLAQIGWVSVLSCMFGRSVQTIYNTVSGQTTGSTVFMIFAEIAVFLSWLIAAKGPIVMKTFNKLVVPAVLFVMIVITIKLFKDVGIINLMNMQALAPYDNNRLNLLLALELQVGGGISWWPNMGAISRLTDSTRTAFWVNILGIGFSCSFAIILGAAAAYSVGGTDPASWMIPMGGVLFGVIALVFVAFANLTSNSVVLYTVCLGLRQFKLFVNRSWEFTTIMFAIPCFILVLFPEFVYGNYQILLTICSLFFVPLTIMGGVDYFVFRKQRMDLRALYNITSDSSVYYWGGVNWVAIFVFLSSILVYWKLLNPFTWAYSPLFLSTSAVGLTAVYTAVAYYVLGKIFLVPKNIGDFNYYKGYNKYLESKKSC